MPKKISKNEKRLRIFGKWIITPIYSLGSAIITTVAVGSLPFIAGLALPYLIPILLFVFLAEAAIHVYLYKDTVPDTLADICIHGLFKNLTPVKKCLLGLGIFSALGGGLALGALTYTSAIAATSAILGLFSVSFPPLGIAIASLLALVACISFSCLLIKWISTAIRNDMHLQVVAYFKELFTRDESKSLAQQILENVFKVTFTFSMLAITIVGTIATLGTMHKGLIKFLTLIPDANVLAVKIASGIIAFALMGAARMPWALQSICSVFSWLGEKTGNAIYHLGCRIGVEFGLLPPPPESEHVVENNEENSWESTGVTILKILAIAIHSVSFGALAKSGGGEVITDILTDIHVPLEMPELESIGEIASFVAGTSMAIGISGHSVFTQPHSPEPPILNSKTLSPSY